MERMKAVSGLNICNSPPPPKSTEAAESLNLKVGIKPIIIAMEWNDFQQFPPFLTLSSQS